MKRRFFCVTIGLIALMTIFSLDAFAKKGKRKKDVPDVVCIHLGEKNPTFDEAAYPDLEFFYVPKVIITNASQGDLEAQGTPEILVPWINARIKGRKIGIKKLATVQRVQNVGITNHYGILFDKNDIAAWEGTITNNDPGMGEGEGWIRGSWGSILGTKKKSVILIESLKKIVRKEKLAKVAKGKTFEPGKRNPVVGIKMPDFDVTNSAGDTKSINSIISGNKAPTLVMFFHISPNAVIAGKEVKVLADDEPFSFKALAKAVKAPTAGKGHIMIFEAIEEQFFGHRRYPR